MRVGQQGHALRSCRQSCFRCPLERVSAVSCHPCRGNVPSACCWPVLEARLAAVRHNRERRRWPVQAQQSRQASSPSAVPLCRDPSLVAGFLEAGCIAAAASLQACILFRSIQQAQTQGQQPASRNTTYLPEQPSYSPTQPTTMLLHSGSAIAVVLALVLNFISRLKWTQRYATWLGWAECQPHNMHSGALAIAKLVRWTLRLAPVTSHPSSKKPFCLHSLVGWVPLVDKVLLGIPVSPQLVWGPAGLLCPPSPLLHLQLHALRAWRSWQTGKHRQLKQHSVRSVSCRSAHAFKAVMCRPLCGMCVCTLY